MITGNHNDITLYHPFFKYDMMFGHFP
jgi:hypothetical protein